MKANKHLATVMAATMVAGSVVPVMAETTNEALIGKNRIETAVKISKDGWNSAETVILVNDGAIADALTATPLAFAKNAPILLTSKNGLSDQVKAEIKRLEAKNVMLIGGNTVLPASIEKELKELGLKPDRIKGDTREETALAIAKRLDAISDVSEIAVVNGTKGLADAVSVAAAAAERHMPILLANPKKGLSASEKFIKDEAIKASYLIGGTTVLPNKMVSSLPGKKRLEGSNRNDTNAKVIETFYKGKELKNVYVAKDGRGGDSQLIDALAVGVLAAKNASPVLIASKNLNAKQVNVINTKEVSNIVQVGGKGNEGAFNQLKEIEKEDVYEVETVEELKEALSKANANDKIVLKPNATITEDIIINTDKNVDIKVEGTVTGKVEITAPNGNVANNSTSKPETNKPSGGGTTTPSVDQNKVNLVNAAKAAKDYKYEDKKPYKYTGEITVTGNESANIEMVGPYESINLGDIKPNAGKDPKKAAMDDMARYLGALYRIDSGKTIEAIKYNGKTYKWNIEKEELRGSNWRENGTKDGQTLVNKIVLDFRDGRHNVGNPLKLTLVGTNKTEVSVSLNFKQEFPVEANGKGYATLQEAIDANGTVKLLKDVTVSETIKLNASKETVIDLNGKTLKSTATDGTREGKAFEPITSGKKLMIKNGNLEATSTGASVSCIKVEAGGSITLDEVNYKTEGTGIFVAGDAAAVNVLNNSNLYAKGFCVSTNAGTTNNYDVLITLNKSTLGADEGGTPILVNVPCTLNITNCEINGQNQGVIVRGGTATITSTTITNNVTTRKEDYLENWGQGNQLPQAALVVGNRPSTAYQYASNVTVTDCTITQSGHEDIPAIYMWGNSGKDMGATLNYNGKEVNRKTLKGPNCTINGNLTNVEEIGKAN